MKIIFSENPFMEALLSMSEYDTDERNDIEAHFITNCEARPNDFKCDVIKSKAPINSLPERLREWAIKNVNNITRTLLNELLGILRDFGHGDLPKCADTLLGTKRTGDQIQRMNSKKGTNGFYIYTGMKSVLERKICTEAFQKKEIKLLINVDGLPLYNKSLIQLWPILVQILHDDYYCKPFAVGMFCGDSKPASVSEFLHDFTTEAAKLIEEGVEIENTLYKVEIAAFVCDTPARAFIKCTKGHSGFYSCERCEV